MLLGNVLRQRVHPLAVHVQQRAAALAQHVEVMGAAPVVLHMLILRDALGVLIFAHAALLGQRFQIPIHRGAPDARAAALQPRHHVVHGKILQIMLLQKAENLPLLPGAVLAPHSFNPLSSAARFFSISDT